MAASDLTQEMKRHVFIALVAKHSNSEIASILNVTRSFMFKLRRVLSLNMKGHRVNATISSEALDKLIKPEIEGMAHRRPYIFQ